MSNEIILYDLSSKGRPSCWSLNPWKARLVLNYKGLAYKTQWVEYPDLKPTFQRLGIPPNPPEINPNAEYSSPAVRLPDGRYIMDSLQIAHEIELLQPEPSLGLDTEYPQRTQEIVLAMTKPLGPITMPRVPEMLLNPSSAAYFYSTREKRWGMPLPELAKSARAGEVAWTSAEEPMEELRAVLGENSEGPFIMGKEPTFADFILAGFWRFLERLDVEGDLAARLLKFDASFVDHRKAVQPWLERDD